MKEQTAPDGKTIICPFCKKKIEVSKFKAHRTKYHRLAKKPDRTTADHISSPGIVGHIDESGFVVSDEFWLENQLLGEKPDTDHRPIGHSAQNKDVAKPDNTFQKIRAMDARYYTKNPPVHPRQVKNININRNRTYPVPNIENLPKLILKQATNPKRPNGSIYSQKIFSQLRLPCKLCGKPFNILEWHEHAREVHPAVNMKNEYHLFQNQYIFCSGCHQVYQFKDAHAHYRREHSHMTIVVMHIP